MTACMRFFPKVCMSQCCQKTRVFPWIIRVKIFLQRFLCLSVAAPMAWAAASSARACASASNFSACSLAAATSRSNILSSSSADSWLILIVPLYHADQAW